MPTSATEICRKRTRILNDPAQGGENANEQDPSFDVEVDSYRSIPLDLELAEPSTVTLPVYTFIGREAARCGRRTAGQRRLRPAPVQAKAKRETEERKFLACRCRVFEWGQGEYG